MHSHAKTLIEQGDQLFNKRSKMMTLWQETADNFYPERGDFTVSRSMGDEFADHLYSSYPILARRDLGNMFSSMLRPSTKTWFRLRHKRAERMDVEGKRWLEWAGGLQRRAMYDRAAQMVRATREGDHDFATFGQCALTVELNQKTQTLLYRNWHLRDVAWRENASGEVDTIHRKWEPCARDLAAIFGTDVLDEKVRQCLEKEPYKEIRCRHIVMPAEAYAGEKKYNAPYVSIHIDVEHQHVMEEKGVGSKMYVIPRWQTVSGSQYAYSPATIASLPDARLIQAITRTLLEAGEKYTNPPMLATQEAIRGDVNLYAGGVTWVDSDYDERLGEVLRPLTQDKSGVPVGMEQAGETAQLIARAFFLNQLNLPPPDRDMTAYETAQRVQEYVRQALPLFEPMEMDYNGALCEETFNLLMDNKAFGSPESRPPSLQQGADVEFVFESPLSEAIEREKGQRFMEMREMLAMAADMDQNADAQVDVTTALREALAGVGTPANWIRPEKEAMAEVQQRQQMAQMQQAAALAQEGGQAAEQIGKAEQALRGR